VSFQRHVAAGPWEAAAACAAQTVELINRALTGQATAALAVSGGTTPALMFDALVTLPVEWGRVHIFWVDERNVSPGDPQSNYTLTDQHLLSRCRIPRANVHRIQAELGAQAAARKYAAELQEFFRPAPGALPQFDIVHLGLGPDAHTASLFPGEALIEDRSGLAAAVYVEKLQQWRITLLPGVLLAARHTLLLATGAEKAEPLYHVMHDGYDPLRYPAQAILHHARDVDCFLDTASSARLGGG